MQRKHKAYVALGSNLIDPKSQVHKALLALNAMHKTKLVQASSLYKTAPVGYDNQPDFINSVAELATDLSPETLMQNLLDIELQFGRERPFANAPRVLDLDLLLFDDVNLQTNLLTLPHPRMHERGFVLLPLAEIAPEIIIPSYGNVVKLAEACKNQGVTKLTNEN